MAACYAIYMKYLIYIFFAILFLNVTACPGQGNTQNNEPPAPLTEPKVETPNLDVPPLLIKHLGVVLDDYNSTTGYAGDFRFTKGELSQKRIWMDYGYVISGSQTSTGKDKANPQPTFILPLGTKVHSLVDGIVVGVPKLYSNDYSIQVAASESSPWRYETEHVINPLVKVGDHVAAGQVIAEVSTWDSHNNDGMGMVEIGILKGGNPPQHVCPFAYLDPSIKEQLQNKIRKLYQAWESYVGDTTLYDEAAMPVTGCVTLSAIDG